VPGDQGAGGVRRQAAGERGQQVELPLRFRDGQRDGAAIGRRELIGLLGQDRCGVRGLFDGRDRGQALGPSANVVSV
jgi:hypothetical protein